MLPSLLLPWTDLLPPPQIHCERRWSRGLDAYKRPCFWVNLDQARLTICDTLVTHGQFSLDTHCTRIERLKLVLEPEYEVTHPERFGLQLQKSKARRRFPRYSVTRVLFSHPVRLKPDGKQGLNFPCKRSAPFLDSILETAYLW